MIGSHVIKTWSSTQPSITLSSGEAEFYGVVKACGVGLGIRSLLRDLGRDSHVRVWTDSSAAIGVCSRQGLGKLRHLDTHTLWVQQAVRRKDIELRKVDGTSNPADLFTKHLPSRDKLLQLVELFGCDFREGRPHGAPELKKDSKSLGGVTPTPAQAHYINLLKRAYVYHNDNNDDDDGKRPHRTTSIDADSSSEVSTTIPREEAERAATVLHRLPHQFSEAEIEQLYPQYLSAPALVETEEISDRFDIGVSGMSPPPPRR